MCEPPTNLLLVLFSDVQSVKKEMAVRHKFDVRIYKYILYIYTHTYVYIYTHI